jgi:hypothetical protein
MSELVRAIRNRIIEPGHLCRKTAVHIDHASRR